MGQKRYNQKDGVGKSKYVISYHDGKKKHKDGSDFFDIQIFRNKKDLAKFVNTLHKGGYKYGFAESVNEAKYYNKADALTAYFKGKIDAKELDKIARNQFKSGIATKKELSNFLSNKFTQDVMSDTYGIPAGTLVKRVRGLMKFAESINEKRDPNLFYVLYQKKGEFNKPAAAGYKTRKDAEDFAKSLRNYNIMILNKQEMKHVKGVDIKEELSQAEIDKLKKIEKELKNASDIHKAQSDALAKGSKTHAAQADRISKMYEKLHKKLDLAMYQDKSGVPQGYNPMVEAKNKESKVIEVMYKYSKTEKKFYDKMAEHERRIGQRDYAKFIIMALKGFGINPRQYKRIPDAEEKLYQTVSKK